MDRLHFNFRRKSKGTSLAQWLIPGRFQFPALESQGIRLLQRRILAEVNCSVPAPFLTMQKFSGSVLQMSAPPPQKNPQNQTSNLPNNQTITLQKIPYPENVSLLMFKVRLFLRKSLALSLDNVAKCPRESPTLMLQDAFYIQTHTWNLLQL